MLLLTSVLAGSLATAGEAVAYGPQPQEGPCAVRVREVSLPTSRPRGAYVVWDDDVWVYLETNGRPGLQRKDAQCRDSGRKHDTVVFSTRIACTCDYPFGYLPVNRATESVFVVSHWAWWQLLPVLMLLPPLPV